MHKALKKPKFIEKSMYCHTMIDINNYDRKTQKDLWSLFKEAKKHEIILWILWLKSGNKPNVHQ